MRDGMSPFFSVIIPVFNRAHVLEGAIRSVLAQSDQDFEIVVVDDGSTDSLGYVMDRIADARIRYIRKDNGGGGSARNVGIDVARGRFVAFLDSDDVYLAGHLAAMRSLLEGTHKTVGYARVLVDRGAGKTFLKPPRAIRPDEDMANYLMCDRGFVPTITLVVDREEASCVRYDETLPIAQDTDFAIRLALAGCRFVMAPEPGAVWHDIFDPGRASIGRKGVRLQEWLERLKPRIPLRAYHGARGWMIAKGVAVHSNREAFSLYWNALVHGCYSPKLAAVIFLQIFFPDHIYRRIADGLIGYFRGRVWSRAETGSCSRARTP